MLDHLTRLSIAMQRIDPAIELARRLARQPGWEARGAFLLAHLQEIVDNPPGAVDACQSALNRDPTAHGAPFAAAFYRKLLARNLLRLGRAREARESLETVLATTTTTATQDNAKPDREAQWLLSRAYLQEGRAQDAASALAASETYGAENRLMTEPSPYVGSAVCARCHRAEDRAYQGTRHVRSFHRGPGLLVLPLPDRPMADPDDPKIIHAIERKGPHIEDRAQAGDRVFETVVDYAFGTPERYLTMTGRGADHEARALRLSHYRSAGGSGWDRTSGDVARADTLDDLLGQKIDVRDGVVRCLYCHTTRPRDFRDPPPERGIGPEAADAGIGCERCHGPGANHLAAIKENFTDRAIINVAGAPAATINAQCADCHIVGSRPQIESDPEDPKYVRSTAVTMALSRCHTESSGGMSCLTCHDPHREAEHAAAFYESKCLSCHSRPADPAAPALMPAGRGAVCPVNPAKDCLGCHMPKVPVPALHTTLTDHYVRVHRSHPVRKGGSPR
jgi:hypothetical protein